MNKETLKLALEALELHGKQYPHMVKGYCLDAITAIKEALAQPEQEPYCYTYTESGEEYFAPPTAYVPDNATPLYTTPPQRKPLTDEEIRYALESEFLGSDEKRNWQDDLRVARAIEAAHGIKGEA